jgi:hypothetical protein
MKNNKKKNSLNKKFKQTKIYFEKNSIRLLFKKMYKFIKIK